MICAGVDGGKRGALAAIHDDGNIEVIPMPLIPAAVKKGKKQGRDEYDLVMIRSILRFWSGESGGRLFVAVEKSQPMPPKMPGGGIANYHRGVARGFEWMLVALAIPFELAAPQLWQKLMHAGTPGSDTKQKSIIAAQRLFPGVSLKRTERSRKPDDGCADALLLAEYARRIHA